jgi:hypothetical protein
MSVIYVLRALIPAMYFRGVGTGFLPFLGFPLLLVISPLLHIHLSLPVIAVMGHHILVSAVLR